MKPLLNRGFTRHTARNFGLVELRDYIRVIRKRWQIIVAVTLVVLAGAALATALSPKIYEAQTRLFVSTSGGSDSSALLSGSNFTQQRVLSYADIITTPSVLDPVIKTLQLNTNAATLGAQITATVPLNTVLIEVAITNPNPRVAAQVADAVGIQFTKTVTDLESVAKGQSSPVKVTVVSAPTVPTTPISPKPTRNLALGVMLGLLLGLGLALLRDLLDTTIKTEKDCQEVTDATVIGGIAFDPDASQNPLIVQADPHSLRGEAFPRCERTFSSWTPPATLAPSSSPRPFPVRARRRRLPTWHSRWPPEALGSASSRATCDARVCSSTWAWMALSASPTS